MNIVELETMTLNDLRNMSRDFDIAGATRMLDEMLDLQREYLPAFG